MKILKKQPGKDFVILSLTDIHGRDFEWTDGHIMRRIFEYTLDELIRKNAPDLIVLTGDAAWAGQAEAYRILAECLESYQIPWAPVWGNHDNQDGARRIRDMVEEYAKYPHCVYESGDPAFGNGNYVIGIEEEGRIIEGLLLMDTHDVYTYTNEMGEEKTSWGKLSLGQVSWYREQVQMLQEQGCQNSVLFVHIPISAYRDAAKAAIRSDVDQKSLSYEDSLRAENWKEGYENCYGLCREGIYCADHEDHVMEAIQELGSTTHVVCGHDHSNNFAIKYQGIWLIYGTKTGAGCYIGGLDMIGGTVLRVTSDGIPDGIEGVYHDLIELGELGEEYRKWKDGPTERERKKYTIVRKPEVLDWKKIPTAVLTHAWWSKTADVLAKAQLCYDDENMYVRMSAEESDIRAEHTDLLGRPGEDSCLAVCFSPVSGSERYLSIEVNPKGCMRLGYGEARDRMRIVWEERNPFSPQTKQLEDKWEITYQIPFSFLRNFCPDFEAVPGKAMMGNFYKCGELTVQKHYFSWNEYGPDILEFYHPDNFGILLFK